MRKNDRIILDIISVISDGSGLGRLNGFAVFVKGAAIGDKVEATIIKVNKNYAVGKLEKILIPSAYRIENNCTSFPRCGGCAYRHISYDAELKIKKQTVCDAFKHIGDISVGIEDMLHGKPERYRNKAQYPVGENLIGFYAEHSHRIVSALDCKLQPAEFNTIIEVFDGYRRKNGISCFDGENGIIRNLYIRRAQITGEIMVCVVINGSCLKNSSQLVNNLKRRLGCSLKTVLININNSKNNVVLSDKFINLYGNGYIYDILCGLKIRLSAMSFYQVNHDMAEKLYLKAAEYAGHGENLIDLYCGAGTIGLSMAQNFKHVTGIEIVPSAVEDAKQNAKINNITNAEFICGDAYSVAKHINNRCDTLIVDPPRKGLSPQLPQLIAQKFTPDKIVYVSCNPATLARDCKTFGSLGYQVKRVCAADLFPRTAHTETVCQLVLRKPVTQGQH